MSIKTITPTELNELRKTNAALPLLDVRTPVEFRELHAQGARNIPLDQLDPKAVAAEHSSGPLYVICRSGSRGKSAAEKIAACGHPEVVNVEGGTLAWDQAGLPVNRGAKMISLERQVRIAAGLLVLTGVSIGFLVHPAGFGLSAFVGAGLVFAGVTDFCGMGLLLARMPWNRVAAKPEGPACSTR